MCTHVVEARQMGPMARTGVVLVLSRLLLVSQAVGAALQGRGIDADATAWSEGVHRATHGLTEADVVLLFDELEGRESVLASQALITQSRARFLVLTPCAEGPAWGALLAGGAAAVMPVESSLDEVDAALALVREGGSIFTEATRSRLEGEWFRWLAEDDDLRSRLEHLSPREREVLDLLSRGRGVDRISVDLGVAETTVRSHIKAIRRKLGVGSQLAAVAAVHRLGEPVASTLVSARPAVPTPRRPAR